MTAETNEKNLNIKLNLALFSLLVAREKPALLSDVFLGNTGIQLLYTVKKGKHTTQMEKPTNQDPLVSMFYTQEIKQPVQSSTRIVGKNLRHNCEISTALSHWLYLLQFPKELENISVTRISTHLHLVEEKKHTSPSTGIKHFRI